MIHDNVLVEMSEAKNKLVHDFIENFLGHEPSNEERKEFTIMHGLNESQIYYQGSLIGNLNYEISDNSAF